MPSTAAPHLSPALLAGWLWVIPRARRLRELVPEVTRPRSGLRLSLGIRLTNDHGEAMSLLCNSSPRASFWDTRSTFAWKAGITRALASLADLAYWSQQPVLLQGEDGIERAVRFRLRGASVTDPDAANNLSPADTPAPWTHQRRPDSTLATDYLRDEYRRQTLAGDMLDLVEEEQIRLYPGEFPNGIKLFRPTGPADPT